MFARHCCSKLQSIHVHIVITDNLSVLVGTRNSLFSRFLDVPLLLQNYTTYLNETFLEVFEALYLCCLMTYHDITYVIWKPYALAIMTCYLSEHQLRISTLISLVTIIFVYLLCLLFWFCMIQFCCLKKLFLLLDDKCHKKWHGMTGS